MQVQTARTILAIWCCVFAAVAAAQEVRSVAFPSALRPDEPRAFEASQSAALFIGIREFTHDTELAEVRYAVDDAVDLASALSMERLVPLVPPDRVLLALAGEPEKEESRRRLQMLRERGAAIHPAGQTDILRLLERQAKKVGKKGILIVGIATHGFSADGLHYLLASNSLLRHRESALPTHKLLDIAAHSEATRSLILLDACRTRLTTDGTRSVEEEDERSAAPLLDALAQTAGHVVFYAAAPGNYAYDDEVRQNGVFTSAVLDGLRCGAPADERGLVTADSLAAFVEERVREWVHTHRDRRVKQGIQATRGSRMPLAMCTPSTAAGMDGEVPLRLEILAIIQRLQTLTDSNPARVQRAPNGFSVQNAAGLPLWGQTVRGDVVQVEVEDLDGDGSNEVIVATQGTGDDAGKVFAYGPDGKLLWSADLTTTFNYDSARSGRMIVRAFAMGDLFRTGTRQLVVLSQDSQGWFPSRLCIFDRDGTLLASYWHPGHLHHVVIGASSERDEPRIIVSGVNNDLSHALGVSGYVSSVFVLDPKTVAGEAPPYLGHSPKGTQLWYGIVLPSEQQVERLEVVDSDQDGHNEISVWCSSQNVFYLTFGGNLMKVAKTDGARTASEFYLVRD